MTAVAHGAVVQNHTEAVFLLKQSDSMEKMRVCGALVRDNMTGEVFEVRAKGVINATGPFTGKI